MPAHGPIPLPPRAAALLSPPVTELAFVLLFTAAGIAAALVARRAAGDLPVVRWLTLGFLVLAGGNLALSLWRLVSDDPGGAARAARIIIALAIVAWAYRLLLGRLRRMAERRRP
jgi:hypothetical protein